MSEIFLETNNSKRIMERARRIVRNGFNLVVTGSAGSGKSAIAEELARELKNSGHYVVDFLASTSKENRTNFYLRMLIKELEPELRIPGAIELKFKEIRKLFLRAYAEKKKVVLIIDEAQNLNLSTVRGLKNIREQSRVVTDGKVYYILSILLFCKNKNSFLDYFSVRDPGDRFVVDEMELLDDTEVIDIAKSIFGLKFESNSVKKDFVETVKGFPSAIEKIYFTLETNPNFDGVVTSKILISARLLQAKQTIRQAGMNEQDFVEYLRKNHDTNVSANELKKALSGKETKNSESILKAVEEFSRTIGI